MEFLLLTHKMPQLVDDSTRLLNWLESEIKQKGDIRHIGGKCGKCGEPSEKGGLCLGFCKKHNFECLKRFSDEIKPGAWSYKKTIRFNKKQ